MMTIHKICCVLAAVATLALPASGSTGTPPVTQQDLARTGAPGMVYLVLDGNGERIEAQTLGVKKAGGDDPVTLDTPFLIGSISKSFTALAVMQLVEAGAVELDTPIRPTCLRSKGHQLESGRCATCLRTRAAIQRRRAI